MNGTNELGWDAAVWKAIDDAVVAEMGRVRSAQKVLPATLYDSHPPEVVNEVINFSNLSSARVRPNPSSNCSRSSRSPLHRR